MPSSAADNDNTTLTLSGTCAAGSTVKIYSGSTKLGDATVTGTTWTFTSSVSNALAYAFNVTVDVPAQPISATTVVFDYVGGVSSSHSNRTFDANLAYTIYVRVHSKSGELNTAGNSAKGLTFGSWKGGNTLGAKDKLILVGNGGPVMQNVNGAGAGPVTCIGTRPVEGGIFLWKPAPINSGAPTYQSANSVRGTNAAFIRCSQAPNTAMWTGKWTAVPNRGLTFHQVYLTDMPPGVLTSQGLV